MSDFIFVHKFWNVWCLICHLPIVHFNAIICIADFAFIFFLKFSQKLDISHLLSVEDNTFVVVAYKLECRSTLDGAVVVVSSSQACS